MKRYSGIPAAPGLVVASVHRIPADIPALSRTIDEPHTETARLKAALALACEELQDLEAQTDNPEYKDILFFQNCLLEDEGLLGEVRALIDRGVAAAAAMEQAGRRNADRLHSIPDNEYLQQRGVDVLDACQRVVDILDGRPRRRVILEHPAILACERLRPSDLMAAPRSMILGVASAASSPQSHAAIIARSMGIPTIVQLGQDFLDHCDGRVAAMDAEKGVMILDPTAAVRQQIVGRICAAQRRAEALIPLREAPCRTADGTPFAIEGNCFGPEDIRAARAAGAQAIGLVRTEYLLLRGYTPGEEEQYDFYVNCLAAAGGVRVTMRTFDIGADMTTGELVQPERNPELGLRGIRYSLAHPQEFEAQLCALLRAGLFGPLRVNLPMIGDPEDWKNAMRCVEHAKELLRRRGEPFDDAVEFGMTLEIPSACLEAAAFPPLGCRFFSLGLNDLIQYTHAANRNAGRLAGYYRADSEAMHRLVEMALAASREADIPISVGGLPVESPDGAAAYLWRGLRCFLVPAQNILTVKQALLSAYLAPPEKTGNK